MNRIKKILIWAIATLVGLAFCVLAVIVYQIICGGGDINTSLSSAITVFGIVSGIGSLVSLLEVIFSILNDAASNIRTYYNATEKEDITEARHLLYKYRDFKAASGVGVYSDCDFDAVLTAYSMDEKLNVESREKVLKASSKIANFYQMWGLLYKNGSLPISIYKTSAGINLLRLYDSIEDIIKEKQKENELYAKEFIDLCEVVKKKYNPKVEPSKYTRIEKKEEVGLGAEA